MPDQREILCPMRDFALTRAACSGGRCSGRLCTRDASSCWDPVRELALFEVLYRQRRKAKRTVKLVSKRRDLAVPDARLRFDPSRVLGRMCRGGQRVDMKKCKR